VKHIQCESKKIPTVDVMSYPTCLLTL